MPNDIAAPHRIANLLPPGPSDMFWVPPQAIASGFTSEVVELETGIGFVNELDRMITGLLYVEAGVRAEADAYSAIFINTVGDYGLRELRSVVSIPVVGAGEATFQIAAGLADRFGVLTVWPKSTGPMYRRLLADYGHTARCIGVRHILGDEEVSSAATGGGFLADMIDLREAAISRLLRGALELIDQGADAIALGCTCMTHTRQELQDRLGYPVVDPILAGHKTAEMLVTMGLSRRPSPVPSDFVQSIPAMTAGISSQEADLDACGDTCSILASPAADASPAPA
jgi:allantoin racemase